MLYAARHGGGGGAPVVENKQKLILVGVVTERDICHGVAVDDRRASAVRVEEIMRPAANACCGADESLEEAQRKLDEHQSTSLPVINKAGSCCGTISLHQIQKS